ncbi:unnamed protein product [Auanema sp. JU1783]|nr:unnamed protein product [Auanema sp. JU1783]
MPIQDWNRNTPVFSSAVAETALANRTTTLVLFGIEALTIIIFLTILLRNRFHKIHFKKRIPNIANKYQVKENQAVIEKLLPICIIHFVIMGINCCGYVLIAYIIDPRDTSSFAIYLESINQAFLYSLIMPIVVEYISKKRAVTSKISHVEPDQDQYFNTLKVYFDQPLRKK